MLSYAPLIHRNLAIILAFAYSWANLHQLLNQEFKGEWRYLRKTIDEIGPERATQAFIELAAYMRLLDDQEDLSGYLRQNHGGQLGRVLKKDRSEEPLYLRDLTNKIIHAKEWKWDVSTPNDPKLICVSNDPDRWVAAEIEIRTLAAFCGMLMRSRSCEASAGPPRALYCADGRSVLANCTCDLCRRGTPARLPCARLEGTAVLVQAPQPKLCDALRPFAP